MKKKKYQDMTAAELAWATRKYDRPGTIDRTRPMTPAERSEEQKARRAGRPKIGMGIQRINISIEGSLLAQADEAARRQKVGRSQLIAEGLRLVLRAAG
jgi:hypothetical protein